MRKAPLAGGALDLWRGYDQEKKPLGEVAASGAELRSTPMLLQRAANDDNPPNCGERGQNLWREPDTIALRFSDGKHCVLPHPGWGGVFAWVIQEHMTGVRVGDRVILTQMHYSWAWGNA